MILCRLAQLDQNTITALGVNKNYARTMGARRRGIGKKLIALFPQANNICIDIVGTKTQVMQSTTFFLQVGRNRAFAI